MNKDTEQYLVDLGAKLLSVTTGCRDDMHEPDEQDVTARVIGTKLDNACGELVSSDALLNGYQELVVVLDRHYVPATFNLASLIALARIGATHLQKE